jgi:hypothetical protein
MAFTYTSPSNSESDAVRFYCGDTEADEFYASDEEIAFALDDKGDVLLAALVVAEYIYRKLAKRTDKKNGQYSVSASQKFEQYGKVVQDIKDRIALDSSGVPYAGGISLADKLSRESDTDRTKPAFTRSMFENC